MSQTYINNLLAFLKLFRSPSNDQTSDTYKAVTRFFVNSKRQSTVSLRHSNSFAQHEKVIGNVDKQSARRLSRSRAFRRTGAFHRAPLSIPTKSQLRAARRFSDNAARNLRPGPLGNLSIPRRAPSPPLERRSTAAPLIFEF